MRDTSLANFYTMSHFMKQRGSYSIDEQKNMYPFEWELYYYQTVNDFKEREEARRKAEQAQANLR